MLPFKMHFLYAQRRAGVFLNISAKFEAGLPSGWLPHRHHVWKWCDSCSGEMPPSTASDYGERGAFSLMHQCIFGSDEVPYAEPNQILRLLLVCSGYKFSTWDGSGPPGGHASYTIIPRSNQTSHSDCVTGWSILQSAWELGHGVDEANTRKNEVVFAVDDHEFW